MVKISYCITAHDELVELQRLLPRILKYYVPDEDQILVQLDMNHTPAVSQYVLSFPEVKVYTHHLMDDFAQFKNNFLQYCTGEYVFAVDADELPHDNLLITLKEILYNNPQVDMFLVPRINLVAGITPEYIESQGWIKNEKGYINYPDLQQRIFKNNSEIKWVNNVHEVLTGHKTHSILPFKDCDDYCLLHVKSIERQKRQNELYARI